MWAGSGRARARAHARPHSALESGAPSTRATESHPSPQPVSLRPCCPQQLQCLQQRTKAFSLRRIWSTTLYLSGRHYRFFLGAVGSFVEPFLFTSGRKSPGSSDKPVQIDSSNISIEPCVAMVVRWLFIIDTENNFPFIGRRGEKNEPGRSMLHRNPFQRPRCPLSENKIPSKQNDVR